MSTLKKYLLVVFLASSPFCFSQNPDIKRTYHWYFGNGAGIDFSSGTAVADTNGKLHTYEGCTVISDTAGNLLFYTDGDTVWNKNHQSMPNGTGLMGCGNYGSTAQAALIVPHPENDSLFYIFTNDCWNNNGADGFRYTIINIKLNSGLGDVISKNNLLFAPSMECVAATKGADGKSVWILTHEYNTSNFLSYKLDSTGLNITPMISSIGVPYTDLTAAIKISPNGKKLASYSINGITCLNELYDFDNNTGLVSNRIGLYTLYCGFYPCFSPDNSKLYFTFGSNYISQFCLTGNNDSVSISNTWNVIINNPDSLEDYGQLSIGPDRKIYIATLWQDSISIINQPNKYGYLSDVLSKVISLEGKECELGIPNFIDDYFYDSTLTAANCDSIIGIFENTNSLPFFIYPNPASQTIFLYSAISYSTNITLKIYNLLGTLIAEQINYSSFDGISISDISNGIYIIKIETSTNVYSQKLIINN
ncbi:MAG: T9SS type A sorting domain-containing protein [Bacteroidetes bacterium]|nr:T9SS type A sorting domain-containing protein [Bacteroidota bacterium]